MAHKVYYNGDVDCVLCSTFPEKHQLICSPSRHHYNTPLCALFLNRQVTVSMHIFMSNKTWLFVQNLFTTPPLNYGMLSIYINILTVVEA